jgi:VWFA-related protein
VTFPLLSRAGVIFSILFFAAGLSVVCGAQQPFPGEPANPPQQQQPIMPPANTVPGEQNAPGTSASDGQYHPPTIRVNTTVVLVPTLVEKSSGDVIYGLQPKDFTLLDNGVPQKVHVDEDLDSQPVSLLICVQRGGDATLEFDKFARLGPLLQMFLGDEQSGNRNGEAALVAFDSHAVYLNGFESDTSDLERQLQNLPDGDGGAAILDAAGYSIDLLEHRPDDHRRVLLLISETRDHGSRNVTIPQLVEQIGESNTLVLSLAFSPTKAELIDWGKGNAGGGSEMNLLAPLMMAINAMRKNVPKTLASMSGGQYASFTLDKGFEKRLSEEAKHARNRYMLSFRPTDSSPGLHTIQVKLTQDYGAHVVARASYWAVNDAAKAPQ